MENITTLKSCTPYSNCLYRHLVRLTCLFLLSAFLVPSMRADGSQYIITGSQQLSDLERMLTSDREASLRSTAWLQSTFEIERAQSHFVRSNQSDALVGPVPETVDLSSYFQQDLTDSQVSMGMVDDMGKYVYVSTWDADAMAMMPQPLPADPPEWCPTGCLTAEEHRTDIDLDTTSGPIVVPECEEGVPGLELLGEIDNNSECIVPSTFDCDGTNPLQSVDCHEYVFTRSLGSAIQQFTLDVGQGAGCNGELDLASVLINGECVGLSCGGSQTRITFTFPLGQTEIRLYLCVNSSAQVSIMRPL